jgi:hypothetical protein
MKVWLETSGLGELELVEAELLTAAHAKSCNTWEEPGVVQAEAFEDFEKIDGRGIAKLPPLGFAALTLKVRA